MIKGDVVAVVHLHSCVRLFTIPWTTAHQASLSFTFSQSFLNSRYHLTISSSVIPFAFCLWSFPASGSFLVSQLFASGGQSIGVSASASVLPVNIQDWFPLGWTGWIPLQSKGLSRVFSKTLWHRLLKYFPFQSPFLYSLSFIARMTYVQYKF